MKNNEGFWKTDIHDRMFQFVSGIIVQNVLVSVDNINKVKIDILFNGFAQIQKYFPGQYK